MMCQLGAQLAFEQRLLQLLEKAVLAQQVFRLFVTGQQLVKMFWLDRHRVVSFVRLTTVPSHTIFLTLPTIGIVRAKVKIGLQNLAYNIRRLVFLERTAAA